MSNITQDPELIEIRRAMVHGQHAYDKLARRADQLHSARLQRIARKIKSHFNHIHNAIEDDEF